MNTQKRTISVVGLGYVGLPVASAFARAGFAVVGFDINTARIDELNAGHDRTREVEAADVRQPQLHFTADASALKQADFHIITVPTPITQARIPDLGALKAASKTVGQQLKRGDIVVYESTVYPGCTEEDCLPILEFHSGLKGGVDFTIGYSPERINPGDKTHRFETIKKVVSGQDAATLKIVAATYGVVVQAGIFEAASIKVAEAAKVIENSQRDLNIAFMNELSLIFARMGIDTHDVLAAAGTKWNFLPFTPGLVGGHCIGVDPYYLTHKAQSLGYHAQVILSGRRVNDDMGAHIAREAVRLLLAGGCTQAPSITILGFTFKENIPDTRNTRVVDIVQALANFGIDTQVFDPQADAAEALHEYGLQLVDEAALVPADAVIFAVSHTEFVEKGWPWVQSLLKGGCGIVLDIKGVLPRDNVPEGITLWRL